MRAIIVTVLVASGCTTLGPMPSTTGVSAIPVGRPGGEVTVGVAPSFHLSSAASKPRGSATGQAAVLLEPDHLLAVPGLILGGRVFGKGEDSPVEPMIGYRNALDEAFAVAVVAFGSSKRATQKLASYHGFRLGAEAAASGQIIKFARWLHLHGQAAASLTRVVASGRYCTNPEGIGIDCSEDMPENNVFTLGKVRGFYPSATATIALDVGRHGTSLFHSLRLAVMSSVGRMPRVEDGDQRDDDSTYFAFGVSATLGLGH